MSNKLKRVKKMSQLKKGDRVLLFVEPEVVEVTETWSGDRTPLIDGANLYARNDDDLKYAEGVKVYKLGGKK